jgi:hypothetical protein
MTPVKVSLLKVPLQNGAPSLNDTQQIDLPLMTLKNGFELFYGAGVLAGSKDGYIYVYGRLHKDFQVQLVVARVKPDLVEKSSAWQFWDGRKWGVTIEESASLGEGGPELSVTRMSNGPLKGKYLLISMPISDEVFMRVGDSPSGPFGPKIVIYKTSETNKDRGIYTYNAKAHPALSKNGELLISYNVNTSRLNVHKDAEIYRPRFIKLKFAE